MSSSQTVRIRYPWQLLWWLIFKPLSLRRYAQSIHAKLNEELKVWQVEHELRDNPRFIDLCNALWWLLIIIPALIIMVGIGICNFFDPPLIWKYIILFCTGYSVGGPLIKDILLSILSASILSARIGRWQFIEKSSWWALFHIMGLFFLWGSTNEIDGNEGLTLLGALFGMIFGNYMVLSCLHFLIYLLEIPYSRYLSHQAQKVQLSKVVMLWYKQPLHFGQVISLPLVGLQYHLATLAKVDISACQKALAEVKDSENQQWSIPKALHLILAQEVLKCRSTKDIISFTEEARWINEERSYLNNADATFFDELRGISTGAKAALDAVTNETREVFFLGLVERMKKQRNILRAEQHDFDEGLAKWQNLFERELLELRQKRQGVDSIPMLYISGHVLETGSKVFRGRDDLFRSLENLIVNYPDKTTAVLLGQPRTGKSSALQQFPVRLGDKVVSVFFDMERQATASDVVGLLSNLVREIRSSVEKHPNPFTLPTITEADLARDPYRLFGNWLDDIERLLGEKRWLLISIDEFHKLDEAVKSGRIDERIFSLLRSLIQHHPQIVLTLSGIFTLKECDPRWTEALKSTQILHVSFLKREEAWQVFTKPTPDFPDGVYTDEAVELALAATGRQPFLLHAVGKAVITAHNRRFENVPLGTPSELPLSKERVEEALSRVLKTSENQFASIHQWLLKISNNEKLATQLLQALAKGQPLGKIGSTAEREDLLALFTERDLLEPERDGQYQFKIPLLARWLREQRRLG